MRRYDCIVIDDEELSRDLLENFILKTESLRLLGKFKTPLEALPRLDDQFDGILFLDIQMPDLTGIDFLKNLPAPPITVLTTAYSEYAIQGYELNVTDYLLKPIDRTELVAAVSRVTEKIQQNQIDDINVLLKKIITHRKPKIAIPTVKGIEMIDINEIVHCEASSNYTIFYFHGTKKIVTKTLKEIEQQQ